MFRSRRTLGLLLSAPLVLWACGSGTATSSHSPGAMMSPMEASGMTAASMAGMPMDHAEVTVAASAHYGNVLYDKDHFVLYMFSADKGSTSTCYGSCSAANGGWPPLLTKGRHRSSG